MEYSDITYDAVDWKDYPSTSTKLNAENLSKPEKGILKLVTAITELRTLLGTENLTTNYKGIIHAINELCSMFGGYSGYNLLDMESLVEVTNGFSISGTIAELGLEVDSSYTISMAAEEDVYFYQYDNNGEMLSTEIIADGSSIAFTINSNCESIKIFFPKSQGYISKELCVNAKVMLEKGTEKHDYEPYTGGEEMRDLWQEILENQNAIHGLKKQIYTFSNMEIRTDAWLEDNTYEDYPYKAAITCLEVDGSYVPYVTYDIAEAISGMFAPVATTDNNKVYVYANGIPENNIIIPTIQCIRKAG